MKTIVFSAFAVILFACQSQENQINESSRATSTNVPPTIKLLKEKTMMLLRQDREFAYYEKNPSDIGNENSNGVYRIHQICNELAEKIKKNEDIEAAKNDLINISDSYMHSLMAMGHEREKENTYLIYQSISSQLMEIDFNSTDKSQALLNLAIIENILVQNIIDQKYFSPYVLNSYEPIAFAETNTVNLNDSILLQVGLLASDSINFPHVRYTNNPKDLDNNNNITNVKGNRFYLKGEKKGNHTLYGVVPVKTKQGEDRWFRWEYHYTVK